VGWGEWERGRGWGGVRRKGVVKGWRGAEIQPNSPGAPPALKKIPASRPNSAVIGRGKKSSPKGEALRGNSNEKTGGRGVHGGGKASIRPWNRGKIFVGGVHPTGKVSKKKKKKELQKEITCPLKTLSRKVEHDGKGGWGGGGVGKRAGRTGRENRTNRKKGCVGTAVGLSHARKNTEKTGHIWSQGRKRA